MTFCSNPYINLYYYTISHIGWYSAWWYWPKPGCLKPIDLMVSSTFIVDPSLDDYLCDYWSIFEGLKPTNQQIGLWANSHLSKILQVVLKILVHHWFSIWYRSSLEFTIVSLVVSMRQGPCWRNHCQNRGDRSLATMIPDVSHCIPYMECFLWIWNICFTDMIIFRSV